MALSKDSVGPASLLKKGTSWLDPKVVFTTKNDQLADAAAMIWKVTRQLRARQGEISLSNSALGFKSGVRRQTVADVLAGAVWPDTRTLGRICSALGLDLTTINQE